MLQTPDTQHHHLPSDDHALGRIRLALGTVTADQARAGTRSVATALSAFLPPGVLIDLAQRLRGEVRQAILDAASTAPASLSYDDGDASLVMQVAGLLPRGFPAHACAIARIVLAEIAGQAGPDGARAIVAQMPDRLRKLWPAPVWRQKEAAHAV